MELSQSNVRFLDQRLKGSKRFGLAYTLMQKYGWKVNKIREVTMRRLFLADECEFLLIGNEEKAMPINVESTTRFKAAELTLTKEHFLNCTRVDIFLMFDSKYTMK